MSAGTTYEGLLSGSPSGGLERAAGGGAPRPPDPERLNTQLSDETGRLEARLGNLPQSGCIQKELGSSVGGLPA
ncbi:hypothetical protein PV726_43505 [Streptomyces europaeiscabiei]|uniref:hypothetical protein n=1 Tax=Streptomyces europaeiscabiei TaxID=146819 RepID=UPI0029AD8ED5|nr:hypothetical protein [Streptomyces europaeiscabiei]MDX3696991.1 hypothetical protein [Streptomyces europaeiscabiei]